MWSWAFSVPTVERHDMARIPNPEGTVSLEQIKIRYLCGRVLALWTKKGFELRCEPCERTTWIPFTLLQDGRAASVDLHAPNGKKGGAIVP